MVGSRSSSSKSHTQFLDWRRLRKEVQVQFLLEKGLFPSLYCLNIQELFSHLKQKLGEQHVYRYSKKN